MEKTNKMKKRLMYALYLAIVVPFVPALIALFSIGYISDETMKHLIKIKQKMLK